MASASVPLLRILLVILWFASFNDSQVGLRAGPDPLRLPVRVALGLGLGFRLGRLLDFGGGRFFRSQFIQKEYRCNQHGGNEQRFDASLQGGVQYADPGQRQDDSQSPSWKYAHIYHSFRLVSSTAEADAAQEAALFADSS